MTRLRAWLELTRGANLPTVWSNLLVGWLLAVASGATLDGGSFPTLGAALLGATLLYTAGMFLNDAADVGWDGAHRPDRPIPSGRLPHRQVALAGAALLLLGVAAFLRVTPGALAAALVLAALILAYTRWHKSRPALAPWLMGACRAFLPVVGFATAGAVMGDAGKGLLLAHAAALALATAGITLLARHEATGGRPAAAAAVAWIAPLPIPAYLLATGTVSWSVLIGTAGLGLGLSWTATRIADIGARVATRIAGLALLDYLLWLAIRPAFDRADPLSQGGLMLLLFFGTALALRRLLPST